MVSGLKYSTLIQHSLYVFFGGLFGMFCKSKRLQVKVDQSKILVCEVEDNFRNNLARTRVQKMTRFNSGTF